MRESPNQFPPEAEPNTGNENVVTRLDVAAEAQRLAVPNHGFHARLHRVRHLISIGLWLLLAVVIVLVFLVGSQPSPPEIETFTS